MPGKIKVKILAGRNLPVMDRSGDTTDAYVEIKFGNTTYKTDVCRKSLNPQWNSEWYRFEVDDAELQDEPLQVRLMDHDTYSANDAIGKVYVNLNPLLLPGLPPTVKNIWTLEATMSSSSGAQGGSVMTGWIPVFDTMHGIRGEVNIIVKVELFSDCNKFRQSSCGVQFFYSPNIPHGYHAQVIHGFVEELVVSDDPEYKWIDKIRTPRASNEARQTLFFKLSGEVQRKIGLKALDLGGNAVIGYVQNFDLEGESGIVARGIGTAVTLVKLQDISTILPLESSNGDELTCFDSQSKTQLDLSESDDSLPLLSHSPHHSPQSRSPLNLHTTTVSPRFPRYEKSRKHPRHAVRIAEYRAAGLRARQSSLQHNSPTNSTPKKSIGSTLSLADDLINESSLRNMLALEDMRGEPSGNPFSRGLKNFRYLHQNILPRRVAQIKSKITDSFDDESDMESNYSSTWSLAGSESNRSPSIIDIRQVMRKKKFTHKKVANDGIAALLIRSVHSGFPLDSVREDRETPTPSPVNFLPNVTDYNHESNRRGGIVDPDVDEYSTIDDRSNDSQLDENLLEKQILVGDNEHDIKYKTDELLIPMISSSETDTSSSSDDEDEDDEEDDPSESSTNYNILDDRYSLLMDPSSNDDTPNSSNCHPSTGNDGKLCEIKETIEDRSEKTKKIEIDLKMDCNLESSTDYNILDDSRSLAEHSSIDHDVSEQLDRNRHAEVVEFHETMKKLEEKKSFDEKKTMEIFDHDSRTNNSNEKSHPASDSIPKLSEDSSAITLVESSSSNSQTIEEHSRNNEDNEISQSNHSQPCTLRDCHSTSSTNYHFLDESCPSHETNSLDDENFPADLRQIVTNDSPPKILTTDLKTLEERSTERKIMIDRSVYDEKIISTLKDDENNVLESSTDHNVLDDTWSTNETNSTENFEKFDEDVDRDFDVVPFSGISRASALIPTSQEFRELSMIQTATKVLEKPTDAKNVSLIAINPPPILPKLHASSLSHSAGKSTSSDPETVASTTPTKLKHLKFLPKQKHFDSTEELGFVTSTPVETDVSLFADFETIENSPLESSESPKFDFSPSTSKFHTSKIGNEPSKSVTTDRKSQKFVKQTEKQVCPLGISFDLTRIVNDPKIRKIVVPTETRKISSTIDAKTSIATRETARRSVIVDVETSNSTKKKDKSVKKIERTDTVIYKGPMKNRESIATINRDSTVQSVRSEVQGSRVTIPLPILLSPPSDEHATRLQVPAIKTTNINVQSTFSPAEMKIQQSAVTANRKFPTDDATVTEKILRKYRQHCMFDLIKTIDAKMMIHHGHHERRDSTKSKRKKRDRINASATPSPDSIHRIRSHRRRSKSRSPDRQQIGHPKNHVSSLSTHSFPNVATIRPTSSTIFSPDSTSCNSSCENVSKHANGPSIGTRSNDPGLAANENVCLPKMSNNQNSQNNRNPIVAELFPATCVDRCSIGCKNIAAESISTLTVNVDSTTMTLDPKQSQGRAHDCQNSDSLEIPCKNVLSISKMTNTANTIDDLRVPCSPLTLRQQEEQQPASPVQTSSALTSSVGSKVTANTTTTTTTTTTTKTAIPNMHRRSSDSDLSITPKGNSLAGSDRSMGGHMRPSTAIVRTMNQDAMEMLEYPFITMQQYPPGFILTVGGLVSARSVKLLERITNLEEPESRDAWWTEIRMEVRSHARALACNVVLGYKEEISICDDVCVLNASGTAAVINLLNVNQDQESVLLSRNIMTTSVESEREKIQTKSSNAKSDKSDENSLSGQQTHNSGGKVKRTSESNDHEISYLPSVTACSLCHLPYNEASVPFRVDVSKCAICRRAKVPDVLFTTIELPENIPMTGRGVFVQATVCKSKRDLRGELNAKEISDCLPFLEYELHRLLLNKLRVKGMNAIFGLKVQVSVGERLVIGMAVGTAVYLTALPTPSVPQIASGNAWHNEEQLAQIQKTLIDTVKKNREFYRLKPITDVENGRSITTSDTDESDDDLPDLDLGTGTKDACVLEVDDVEDMDRINLLIDERPPDDFHVVNTQMIPGLEDLEIVRNLQMFTQISRTKIPSGQFASMPSKYFARMLQTVLFKLRRMVPCALCDMQFKIALPEQDEIQLSVVGMALGLGEPTRVSKYKRKIVPNSTSKDPIKKTDDNDMIFSLEEDQVDTTMGSQDSCPAPNQSNPSISSSSPLPGAVAQKHRPRSPFRTKSHVTHRHKHVPLKERYGVDITPLSYLPGGKIERYLGNINFFFIRESTSIRENGGLSGFTHSFVTEILAIVRAHITALGGDAMVAFFMTQCVLLHSPHKNQGQCLINVGGDVVTVSYENDKYQGNQNC